LSIPNGKLLRFDCGLFEGFEGFDVVVVVVVVAMVGIE
jgi:hypothetical protein